MKLILICAVSFLSLQHAYSRPKSIGASFSYTGLGITYDYYLNETSSFVELSLKAESADMFADRRTYPGVSTSIIWNIIIKEWLSSEGNKISLFCGPGAMVGYTSDYMEKDGFSFGLKGRLGLECSYMRNVSISLSISPVIGSHIAGHLDGYSMKYYKNGVMYTLVPEIGIKYRF